MGHAPASPSRLSLTPPLIAAGSALAAGGAGVAACMAGPAAMTLVAGASILAIAVAAGLAARFAQRPLARSRDEASAIALGQAGEASRFRAALDAGSIPLMICDAQNRVILANAALLRFFGEAQDDFRAAFPGCSAKDMLGRVLDGISSTGGRQVARLTLGKRTVELTLSPLADGLAVEWRELTGELSTAAEIAALAEAAAVGDFSGRVAVAGRTEALARIGEGLNGINGVVERLVADLEDVTDGLSQGDLGSRLSGRYEGRLAGLRDGLNEALERLGETVTTIQASALRAADAAGEIEAGAADLASRTGRSAADLEEAAATTEQLAASVKRSATSSRHATALAGEATSVAGDGSTVVAQAIGAIERIEQSSARISEIVTVIDEIAFQTNLLALNAAVEAARAGDAGKGFAVVASEVRALAQRSAQAAKDIKGLIASSNEQVGEGVRHARSTGEALGRIVEAAGKVSATIGEISAAASEQANGVDGISRGIAQLDEATQQNSALAEQSAQASAALMGELDLLNRLAGQFRTGRERAAALAASGPARPANQDIHPEPQRRAAAGGRARY